MVVLIQAKAMVVLELGGTILLDIMEWEAVLMTIATVLMELLVL